MKKYFLCLLPILLTSCMIMESDNTVSSIGDITYNSVLDMSGMVAMMQTYASGSDSDTDISKDLCIDFDKEKTDLYYTWATCASLGDYRARIISILPKANNPGIYVSSGVIVYNVLLSKALDGNKSSVNTSKPDMEMLGIKIEGTFKFPYPIVHADAWVRMGTDTVRINLLDKKVMKRNDLYIIARADGKKPTNKEILMYKQKIRQQLMKARISGKYDDFQDMTGL